MGTDNHVAEGAQVSFLQHVLDLREDAGNFAATFQYLAIRQRVLRFPNPRHGHLAAFQLPYVARILFHRYQFIMAITHEAKQVIKELPDIGGADKILEMEFVQPASKVNP